jgi:hypothetical protein
MKKRISKPTLIVDADGKKRHPLVFLAQRISVKEIGKMLGHTNHTTASIYVGRARKTPTLTIPSAWVLPLARYLDLRPAALRPDLYLPNWTVDNGN